MRVFLAGASGVIGRRLIPLLTEAGHDVTGSTRSQALVGLLRDAGAKPVVVDVYDQAALSAAIADSGADVVVHELTDLPDQIERVRELTGRNARMRTEGTRNLLAAARTSGIGRFLAQSIAWTPAGGAEAVADHERMVLAAGGVVLRYGQFYGPGTYYPDEPPAPPRVRVDVAAARTVELLDAPSGVVVIVDES